MRLVRNSSKVMELRQRVGAESRVVAGLTLPGTQLLLALVNFWRNSPEAHSVPNRPQSEQLQ